MTNITNRLESLITVKQAQIKLSSDRSICLPNPLNTKIGNGITNFFTPRDIETMATLSKSYFAQYKATDAQPWSFYNRLKFSYKKSLNDGVSVPTAWLSNHVTAGTCAVVAMTCCLLLQYYVAQQNGFTGNRGEFEKLRILPECDRWREGPNWGLNNSWETGYFKPYFWNPLGDSEICDPKPFASNKEMIISAFVASQIGMLFANGAEYLGLAQQAGPISNLTARVLHVLGHTGHTCWRAARRLFL